MSKILFTEEDIENLKKNKNVARISKKSITYIFEFKRLFIDEYISGKLPRDIFTENGFDTAMIGIKKVEQSSDRWKETYDKAGIIALDDTRKISSSRSSNRELTKEEIIERQYAKIKLLEAQVELLKKLDEKERLLINKNKELKTSDKFELIKATIEANNFKGLTKYFCRLLDVSLWRYYNYINSEDTRKRRESKDLLAKNLILKAFNRRGYKKGSIPLKWF